MPSLVFDKNAFFKHIGYQPHPGQLLVHNSKAPRRIVACGVRFGKTVCAAMELFAAAVAAERPFIAWIVAPNYELTSRVFDELLKAAERGMPSRIIKCIRSERYLELRSVAGTTSCLRCKSAESPDSLLGEGLDFLVIDEAGRLPPRIWEDYLSQRLIDKQGKALLISTPCGKNYFYRLWLRGQGMDPDFESWNLPSWWNPIMPRAEVEKQADGISPRSYRTQYEAEFIEGDGSVFHNVAELATGRPQDPVPGVRYYAGLDVARLHDYTVLVVLNQKYEVVHYDRFARLDWNLQINRVQGVVDRFNRAPLLVDATGVGQAVFELMRHSGLKVEAYTFTQKSKSDLIDNLSILFEQQRVRLLTRRDWPEALDELEAFEFTVTESNATRTGAPSGMHDDIVIALALAAWQVKNARAGMQMRSFHSPEALCRYVNGLRWQ